MGFDINFFSRKHHYHRYSSDDLALVSLGIANYTTSSADLLFKNDPPNPDLKEFFGSIIETKNKILASGNVGDNTMEVMIFDRKEKIYKVKQTFAEIIKLDSQIYKEADFPPLSPAPKDIVEFLDNWDKVQLGIIKEPQSKTYQALAYEIQNSLSGCISFVADLTILKESRKVPIRLALTTYKDSDSDRTISFRDAPLITAIPQTADGLEHSARVTKNSQTGAYVLPTAGGVNNPENTITAQLRMIYNNSTKQYESGTQQILARLTTDIDPANIPNYTASDLLNFTREEIYDNGVDSNGFMGDFTTGTAIPLSKEDGNPYLYGPNFIGSCKDNKNVRTITVTNRSGKSFKKGDLVMCSFIDGEWIVTEFSAGDNDPNKKNLTFGNFEYAQYIVPAKNYFTLQVLVDDFYHRDGGDFVRCLPDDFLQKLRNYYYLGRGLERTVFRFSEYFLDVGEAAAKPNSPIFVASSEINNFNKLRLLNIFASTIPDGVEDTIKYIEDNYTDEKAKELANIAEADISKFYIPRSGPLVGASDLEYQEYYGDPETYVDPVHIDINGVSHVDIDSTVALPKNVLARNGRKLIFSNNNQTIDTSVQQLYGIEVPLFWGMLFPDGYKTNTTSPFIAKNSDINNIPIFANDPNLKELTAVNTLCYPDLGNEQKTFEYIYRYARRKENTSGDLPLDIDISLLIKKTGGYFSGGGVDNRFHRDAGKLNNNPKYVYGLEPLKPNKIQFSPMSLEAMYINSILNSDPYTSLSGSIDFIKGFSAKIQNPNSDTPLWSSTSFEEYAKIILKRYEMTKGSSSIEYENLYSVPQLSVEKSFPSLTKFSTRHPAPYGIVNDMLPSILGYRRSVAMPVLTCKSSIKTSASSLVFSIDQFAGMSPKITINVGFGPQIFYNPAGFGMTWQQTPNIPSNQQVTPQWGDRNGTDDVDSFGTTALHVRVFEKWPIDQTIFFGDFFCPLHANEYQRFKYIQKYTYESGTMLSTVERYSYISPTDPEFGVIEESVLASCTVDFKVPSINDSATYLIDRSSNPHKPYYDRRLSKPLPINTLITSGTQLAPYADWVTNPIRRAQLLSGGGFVYERAVIGLDPDVSVIKPKDPKIEGQNTIKYNGTNYIVGDKFEYPDGTTIEVDVINENGGIISTKVIRKSNKPNITSYIKDLQPTYKGVAGNGVSFTEPKLKVVNILGHDKGPKEVVPITRLTKKSDPQSAAQGINTTTVDLGNESNSSKSYDIFYFFHNDPSHYSIDFTQPFNGGWAQYVIAEVNGA